MTRILKRAATFLATLFPILLALAIAAPASAQLPPTPKDAQGEQFCMVSSIDLSKHQIVLMQPTQLTIVASIESSSSLLGENGQKLALKDLRAGDTVWVITRQEKGGQVVVVKIREGRMTVAELHKLYLKYSPQVGGQAPPDSQRDLLPPQGAIRINPAGPGNHKRRSGPMHPHSQSGV